MKYIFLCLILLAAFYFLYNYVCYFRARCEVERHEQHIREKYTNRGEEPSYASIRQLHHLRRKMEKWKKRITIC